MKRRLIHARASGALLARLIDTPDLVNKLRRLSGPAFSTLVRRVGLEDAGELVALATTEQLVATFDEDLFSNTRAGEREVFDSARFLVWLEVLLEAGEAVAASRVADLSQDFVVRALSSVILVLDHEALLRRMSAGGDDALYADKAIESTFSEEIDGYLLLARSSARDHHGWDALFALILALDRDHRDFLVAVLDRCADIGNACIDDLDALSTALSAEDSLAEDVEAERDQRRSARGYVEPRDARAFLSLARRPPADSADRDAIARAYFRDLEPAADPGDPTDPTEHAADLTELLLASGEFTDDELSSDDVALSSQPLALGQDSTDSPTSLLEALGLLRERHPDAFDDRMKELVFLANVIVAGTENRGRRFRPGDAAAAALATVALGAELEARTGTTEPDVLARTATPDELCTVLYRCSADHLFRRASSALSAQDSGPSPDGLLRSLDDVGAVFMMSIG